MSDPQVYYNSAYPVCNAGINHQRSRMQGTRSEEVEWIDIHAHPEFAATLQTDLEAIRERLHVRAADGSVRIGIDAFIELLSRTRGQRWMAYILKLPGMHTLGALMYNLIARGLYRWNRAQGHW